MNGYPKNLNTKADYEFVRQTFPKNVWKKDFENLLATAKDWFNTGEITGDDVTDDTHRVVESRDESQGGKVTKYQYEYKENPDAKIFKTGYTVAEVEEILEA